MIFEKKPDRIEAVQWEGDNFEEILKFIGDFGEVSITDNNLLTITYKDLFNDIIVATLEENEWVVIFENFLDYNICKISDETLKMKYNAIEL